MTSTIPWLTPTRTLSPSHTRPWPPCGSLPSTACFYTRNRPYPITLLPIDSGYFRTKPLFFLNTPTFSNLVILHTYPPIKMEQSAPKRRHIKFRRRGITQKKAYNIQKRQKFEIKNLCNEFASVAKHPLLDVNVSFPCFIYFVKKTPSLCSNSTLSNRNSFLI